MDSLRGLPGVPGALTVNERRPGQKQADAFRRAMQQGAEQSGQPPADQGHERPVRRTLQPAPPAGRKDEGTVHHVDVIA